MVKYWQRNGTRRPFPAMYEAAKAYGERVWYQCPDYAMYLRSIVDGVEKN